MKFRKKPVVIEAIQLTEKLALEIWGKKTEPIFGKFIPSGEYHLENQRVFSAYLPIGTLEGTMRANLNDWIIKGVKGEFYPCKPDIFEATYEPVQ